MVEKKTSRKVIGLLTALLIMNPIVGDFVSNDKAYAAEAGYVVISDIYSYGGIRLRTNHLFSKTIM